MGLFSSGRGPRSFDYEPRYFDPDSGRDNGQDIKRRMQSQRARETDRSPVSLLLFLGLLFLTLLLYYSL